MALIRTSSIVAGISGSIGGVNFANTRAGPIARLRARHTPRSTEALAAQQVIFANVLRKWGTLTDQQRTTWRSLAANLSRANRLGQRAPPSGFTLFVQSNLISGRWAGWLRSEPPERDPDLALGPLSLTATAPATVTAALEWIGSKNPWTVQILGFRPFSQTLPKFRAPWREVLLDTRAPLGSLTFDMGSRWTEVYGPLQGGESVAITLRVWTVAAMLVPSPPLQAETLVQFP